MINNHKLLFNNSKDNDENWESWDLTINTEATTTGNKTVTIPLDLRPLKQGNGTNLFTVSIDWGDGNKDIITPPDSRNTSAYNTHEYTNVGIYTIKMRCSDYSKFYCSTVPSSKEEACYAVKCW